MDSQTRSRHSDTRQEVRHSTITSPFSSAGLIQTPVHSTKRRISKIRSTSHTRLDNNSAIYSALSSTNSELDTITASSSQICYSPLADKSTFIPLQNPRKCKNIIIPPMRNEKLNTEAEYTVSQDKTNLIATAEQVKYDEHVYDSSDGSGSESVVSLDSILIEEKDVGPVPQLICDDGPFSEQPVYQKTPAIHLRSHSMSDIHRKIHVLDDLLFSIDFEYGASDIGPQPNILSDNWPSHQLTRGKVHGVDERNLKHSSSDTEVIIESMFSESKQHGCCKERRKLSWNSGIRRNKKKTAQLNIVPHRRPRKIVVIGDMCSGKSALISAYCKDRFNEMYIPTILRSCITDADLGGEKIELVVIEISGREDYQKLRNCSYRKTDAIILCYSCDNPSSLDKIKSYWVPEVKEKVSNVPLIIVGTKKDIRDEELHNLELCHENRQQSLETLSKKFVLPQAGRDLSESIGAHNFLECSAKYRDGTRNVFETVAMVAMQKSRRKRKVQKTGDVCSIM